LRFKVMDERLLNPRRLVAHLLEARVDLRLYLVAVGGLIERGFELSMMQKMTIALSSSTS
jgi:hypothetical protein